ncbi:TIGR04255 family protein [Bdellovibrionota bacterium FG-2]
MNFDAVKVPKKITPCPITEAVVELRFDSSLPAEVMPGVVFSKFQKDFPKIEKLPIMELPPAIRDGDPNLRFTPQYRLTNDDFVFQIGPKCFSVVCPKEYKGWTKYYTQLEKVFDGIKELAIIQKPIRVGLRYISFFEDTDIFEKIKINLSLADNSLIGSNNIVRSEFNYSGFRCVIQIANGALLSGKVKGSSVDIDVISDKSGSILSDFKGIVNSAHEVEKRLFFGILNEDFLNKFNPEY